MLKISIIGSGVVGTATGQGFQKMGHEVYFYDISPERLDTLANQGYCTIRNIGEALSRSEVSFICVNTPSTEKKGNIPIQDISQLTVVLDELATVLNQLHKKEPQYKIAKGKRQVNFPNQDEQKDNAKFPLFVFRSTILPGTMRNVIIKYLDSHCSLRRNIDYEVMYNPEFLREKHALNDFLNPDRVVIGEDHISLFGGRSSSKLLQKLYEPLTKNLIVTSFEAAELIKYAANCFLSMKISYFNQLGMICSRLGLDAKAVNYAVSLDKRIGSYGTHAGTPYGGRCLPKDIEAFANFVSEILPLDAHSDLLRSTIEINNILAEETKSTSKRIASELSIKSIGHTHVQKISEL